MTKPGPPTGPTAFVGGPLQPYRVEPARPVQTSEPVVPYVPGLPRSVPVLTVYADGRVNPNREAALLLRAQADGLCFHEPSPARPGCAPRLWEVSPGDCHLFRVAGKAEHTQLRAAGHCPPPGRYMFTPVASIPGRYALVPTG
jgi:hypothetical protein